MELLRRFMKEEDGLGTVEIVLITVLLVGLVFMFKTPIERAMKTIMTNLEQEINEAGTVNKGN